jgi:hypothetical protein
VSIRRPWALVVSAQGSPSDLKLALLSPIVARVLSRSRVDRASRSSLVTKTLELPIATKKMIGFRSDRRVGGLSFCADHVAVHE